MTEFKNYCKTCNKDMTGKIGIFCDNDCKVLYDIMIETRYKEYVKECTALSFNEWLNQGGC